MRLLSTMLDAVQRAEQEAPGAAWLLSPRCVIALQDELAKLPGQQPLTTDEAGETKLLGLPVLSNCHWLVKGDGWLLLDAEALSVIITEQMGSLS